jgi:2,3,4,5-tetrahydropyridine-2-carboxylate N-succinyltransferase
MNDLQQTIEQAWEERTTLSKVELDNKYESAINHALMGLEEGKFRVAQPLDTDQWQVNEWLKKAVLLHFTISDNYVTQGASHNYFDKVPCRFNNATQEDFEKIGARIVPPATIRMGAFLGNNVVVMPSYVNIGAYVDEGTMVDTWVTVGSCAQIGKNVHLSGGVGIGGVLEPLQSSPTIIEDDCFIGARSEVVEGVRIGKGSVLSMGVFISQSTKIYNRATKEITYGYVPPGSVVVPGNLPSKDGSHSLSCAVIVKTVDAQTRAKTSINELLRD